jgi:surfeit locus 1 family protein
VAIGAGLAVVAISALCVRLGVWQLERWREKQSLNAAARAALAHPPVEWPDGPTQDLEGRRVIVRGRYDESRHVLLRGRLHEGEPGAVVVTPLVLASGSVVLIERGWLPADDGLNANPGDHAEPGPVEVIGVLRRLPVGSTPGLRRLGTGATGVISAANLDRDSLAVVFPYPIAAVFVRQLPGPGVPRLPVRTTEPPLDESLHVGYAVQWFAFTVILVVGSIMFAASRGRRMRVAIP